MARLIDADALKEKKVYSHERHEKIVPVAEIDWMPTIDAIPVEWLIDRANDQERAPLYRRYTQMLYEEWLEEQEAR